jgi:hypothetical protein
MILVVFCCFSMHENDKNVRVGTKVFVFFFSASFLENSKKIHFPQQFPPNFSNESVLKGFIMQNCMVGFKGLVS